MPPAGRAGDAGPRHRPEQPRGRLAEALALPRHLEPPYPPRSIARAVGDGEPEPQRRRGGRRRQRDRDGCRAPRPRRLDRVGRRGEAPVTRLAAHQQRQAVLEVVESLAVGRRERGRGEPAACGREGRRVVPDELEAVRGSRAPAQAPRVGRERRVQGGAHGRVLGLRADAIGGAAAGEREAQRHPERLRDAAPGREAADEALRVVAATGVGRGADAAVVPVQERAQAHRPDRGSGRLRRRGRRRRRGRGRRRRVRRPGPPPARGPETTARTWARSASASAACTTRPSWVTRSTVAAAGGAAGGRGRWRSQ
jgi:hypothetical protein